MKAPLLQFDSFAAALLKLLDIDFPIAELKPTITIFNDLALDSFQAFTMLVGIEALADLLVPLDAIPEIYSLGDAYDYYLSAAEAAQLEA